MTRKRHRELTTTNVYVATVVIRRWNKIFKYEDSMCIDYFTVFRLLYYAKPSSVINVTSICPHFEFTCRQFQVVAQKSKSAKFDRWPTRLYILENAWLNFNRLINSTGRCLCSECAPSFCLDSLQSRTGCYLSWVFYIVWTKEHSILRQNVSAGAKFV